MLQQLALFLPEPEEHLEGAEIVQKQIGTSKSPSKKTNENSRGVIRKVHPQIVSFSQPQKGKRI